MKKVICACLLNLVSFVFADSFQEQMQLATNPACTNHTCPVVFSNAGNQAKVFCRIVNADATPIPWYSCKLVVSNSPGTTLATGFDYQINANLSGTWLTPTLLEIKDMSHQDTTRYFQGRYIFIDFQKMLISPVYMSVYAIDMNRMVLLSDTSHRQGIPAENTVFISAIFNSNLEIPIQRNFGGFYDYSIYSSPKTFFLPNGDLNLVYDSETKKHITEVLPIDYSQLGLSNS